MGSRRAEARVKGEAMRSARRVLSTCAERLDAERKRRKAAERSLM